MTCPPETAGLPRLWLNTAASALPEIAREIVEHIRAEVAEYRDDPTGELARETRHAVRESLDMFMRSVAWGQPVDESGADVFRRIGRREARAGRSHDTLQNAYRVASQAVMHQLIRWERDHDAPSEVMGALSGAVFGFISELARYSAEGFAEAARSKVDVGQARAELVTLLVQREGFTRRQLADAAEKARWTVPETVTMVEVVQPGSGGAHVEFDATTLAPDAVAVQWHERHLAVCPGRLDLARLRERAAGTGLLLVVGPTVPTMEAGSSARLAQRLRSRHDVRKRATGGVVTCDDSLLDLVVDGGRDAARTLVATRLCALAAMSPVKRLKYAHLLSAWLEFGSLNGDAPGVLDKHRQTLRYQCDRLESLFGDELHDRTRRLEIMIALRYALPLWESQAQAVPAATKPKRRVRTPRTKKSGTFVAGDAETAPVSEDPPSDLPQPGEPDLTSDSSAQTPRKEDS